MANPLTPEKRLEISEKLLKNMLHKHGFTLSGYSKRDLKDLSKKLGIHLEDLKCYAKPILQEMLDETFA